MALRTFDPGLAYDKATGRGIGSTLALVTDAVSGAPLQTYDMDGNVAPVITNRDGYFGQFQADADRIRVNVGGLTIEAINLDAALGLADSAAAAATSAGQAVTQAQTAQAAAEAARQDVTTLQASVQAQVDQAVKDAVRAAAGVTGVSVTADGTPYLDPAGTTLIARTPDGTPYIY